ncbi:MAG TPA: PAS domain-containing protein [Rhizomicrobium sp.]
MAGWNKSAAVRALDTLGFNATNLALARYWLSLWDGNTPPPRGAISPSHIKKHLPGIAIFDCQPGVSIRCRLAGSAICMGLGMDVTGQDLVALTPPEHRKARLERTSRVARGAISRRQQRFHSRAGGPVLVEDMQLPLSGMGEDGSRQILYHADWRPKTLDRREGEIVDGFTMAEGVEYFELAEI